MVEAPEPAADQVPLHSEWTGKYVCGQGSTGLRLTIESHPSGEAIATFEFGPIPENPTVPVGAYQLKGRLRMTPDGGLEARFVPDQWLNQPSGYMMVGLTVVSDRARRVLRGTIDDPNCAGVEVRRRS